MSDLEQQINEIKDSTILSSFNDKITLLQWLKKLEQAIKESNIKFLDYVKINEFDNKIQIEMSFDGLKVYSNAVDVLTETDDTITEDSTLPVQSGAVYDAIAEINGVIDNINGDIDNINGDIDNINDDIGIINGTIGVILPLDNTPTENSTKGVTSGGVYNAIINAGVGRKYIHILTLSGTERDFNYAYNTNILIITTTNDNMTGENLYNILEAGNIIIMANGTFVRSTNGGSGISIVNNITHETGTYNYYVNFNMTQYDNTVSRIKPETLSVYYTNPLLTINSDTVITL